MIKCGIVVTNIYKNNKLFDLNDHTLNRDNCLHHWYLLKQNFSKQNIELTTYDTHPIDEYKIFIFSDLYYPPDIKPESFFSKGKKAYLILFESELIRPSNWIKSKHTPFERVFTWHDDFVDNSKYIKYFWPNYIVNNITPNNKKNQKLITLIAGNKILFRKNELYSERVNIIRWFEKKHIHDFDLYGIGWENGILKKPLLSIFKISICNKIYKKLITNHYFKNITTPLRNDFPSYKGKIESKIETYSKYKFSICFENAKNIPGYITEKIFDCFFSGCVPIYLGAPNITKYIPSETYINAEDFSSYDDLYNYISNITNDEYLNYLLAIQKFLKSKEIQKFSSEMFSKIIINNIINGQD